MKKLFNHWHFRQFLNYFKVLALPLFFLGQIKVVEAGNGGEGETGSIECVDGKWKVDTNLMALVMTCPLPLDGDADSVMKMVKCAMNKLGMYDGQNLSDDFTESLCNIFAQANLKGECLKKADSCAFSSGIKLDWKFFGPAFVLCFIPWVMEKCNI